ncbi:hypothetical protein GCM10017788_18350 [Amycolatopsis acidiphila]|nr:hypothetical protein GCM10017788_18350 [Amycolatopsis acidiphila]
MILLLLVAAPIAMAIVPMSLSEEPVTGGNTAVAVVEQDEAQLADAPPPPPPATVSAAKPVTTRQPAKNTRGETADERAARVSRDAMIPHPRPPAEPAIAPGVQEAYDSAFNAPPIDLGVLTPTPTTKPSY